MELRMNFSTFIKLKDASKINDISGEIVEYDLEGETLIGIFGINGTYYKDDLEQSHMFKEEVPFDIIFKNNVDILDVDCVDLDFGLVDGRGIDVSFDLKVEYDILEDEVVEIEDVELEIEKIDEEIIESELNIDEIKEQITNDIDFKLTESINYKEDNLPTEESIVSRISDETSYIKVLYYKDDKELETLCKMNNLSIEQVFKNNRDNDINKYQRVIVK